MRDLENKNLLDEYLEIKAQMAQLEEDLEAKKAAIIYALMGEPKETYDHHGATFSIQRRKTYQYSDKVAELEEVLKDAKEYEKGKGIATVTKEQAVLVVKVPKIPTSHVQEADQ